KDPVRQRIPEPGPVDVPQPSRGGHAEPDHVRAGPRSLAVDARVHVIAIRGGRPAAIDQHDRAVGEPQRGDEVHAGYSLVAPAVPQALAGVVVRAADVEPAVAQGVYREMGILPNLQFGTSTGGGDDRVVRAPLV